MQMVPSVPVQRLERRRLRDLLLLALRVGAIVLLAVSFARPYVDGGSSRARAPSTIVAVDTSLSLSAPGQWDAVVRAATRAIADAPATQAVGLVTFDDRAALAVAPTFDRSQARAALGSTSAWQRRHALLGGAVPRDRRDGSGGRSNRDCQRPPDCGMGRRGSHRCPRRHRRPGGVRAVAARQPRGDRRATRGSQGDGGGSELRAWTSDVDRACARRWSRSGPRACRRRRTGLRRGRIRRELAVERRRRSVHRRSRGVCRRQRQVLASDGRAAAHVARLDRGAAGIRTDWPLRPARPRGRDGGHPSGRPRHRRTPFRDRRRRTAERHLRRRHPDARSSGPHGRSPPICGMAAVSFSPSVRTSMCRPCPRCLEPRSASRLNR